MAEMNDRSVLLRYSVAMLAVVISLGIKLLLDPLIVQDIPFLMVFLAVLVSAWYGGFGPALVATLASGLTTDYFFLPPIDQISFFGWNALPLGIFMIEGALVSLVVTKLRSATRRAEESTLEARSNEEELRRSEERFRLMVEGVEGYAIFTLDPRGHVASWNAGAERIHGYRTKEIVGRHFSCFYPAEDIRQGKPLHNLEVAIADGRVEDEGWRIRKDGSRFWASAVITALRDESGELRGFSKVMRDMTERKEAEEALKESEERYRAVVEQAAEGIYLIEADSLRVVDSNAAVRYLLGYTPEEFHRMTIYDIVAHDLESVDFYARRILEEKHHFIGERRYRRKDGSLVDVEVNTSVVSYGGRDAICIVAHDISARKQAERRLHRSLNSLLALYEAGQILGSSLEREELVGRLLGISQRVSGLTCAAIFLSEEERKPDAWRVVGREDLWRRAHGTREAKVAHRAALESGKRRVIRLQTVPEEPVTESNGGDQLVGLYMPLLMRDRLVGMLEAYGPSSLSDEDTVETLANLTTQAASALENARLYEELAEHEGQLQNLVNKLLVAQEEERRRVAYDVHDGLTQVAIAAYQRLQIFAEEHPPVLEQGREDLERSLELARRTVGEARRVIAELRPTALDDFGLARAIRLQLDALRSEGWNVSYEETLNDSRLPGALETALFRVTQEALTNIRKHARTNRVRVTLLRSREGVHLEIRDWGRGFRSDDGLAEETAPGEKVGLSGMQERVSLIGGSFEIRSTPGEGTTVVANVPVPGEETDRAG